MAAQPKPSIYSAINEEKLETDPRHDIPPTQEPAPYSEMPDVKDPFGNPWRVLAFLALAVGFAVVALHFGMRWAMPQ